VQGNTTISGADRFLIVNNTSTGLMGLIYQNASVDQAYIGIASSNNSGLNGSLTHDYFIRSLNRRILFGTSSAIQAMLFNTGNFAINTTTDAGFRLDVNGTARIIQTSFSNNGIQILTNLSAAGGISLNGTLPTSNNMTVSGGFSLFASTTYSATSGNALTINSAVIQSTSGTVGLLGVGAQFAVASGNANFIGLNLTPTLNFTGTFTGTIRGFYYNPTLTSMTGVTAHYAIHTTAGRVRLEGLPTSSAGLSAGDVWNDGGTLKIV
jgi:hypothetical protein